MPGRSARRIALAVVAAAAGAAGACGGGNGSHPVDASPDTPIDTSSGMCGADAVFTGEIVDWDSTETHFCGVFNAKFTVHGDMTRTATTAPNGRFNLCIPHQAQVVVDIVPPAAGSECAGLAGTPMNTYQLQGTMFAVDSVIAAGGMYSARAIVQSREPSLDTLIGAQIDGAKGQLVVHVNGTPHAVSISAAHATTLAFNGTQWAAGDTGSDVYFPNIDTTAAVTISVAGGATGDYTLVPGMNYVSVVVP